MEALEPHGGSVSHASTPRARHVASQSPEILGAPDTPTPSYRHSQSYIQPHTALNKLEQLELPQLGSQGSLEIRELSKTSSRASETHNAIKRRKALQREPANGYRPMQKSIKQTNALAGALELAQHEGLECIRSQLAEELNSWKAQQQIREDLYLERIHLLEIEVSKLRSELTAVQLPQNEERAVPVQYSNQKPANNQSTRAQRKTTYADLAALLATKPGGQEWQEVTKKQKKQLQKQPKQLSSRDITPVKNSPKEARRLLFRREGGIEAPRAKREDVILEINRALANAGFPSFMRVVDTGYTNTGAISILLEKGSTGSILLSYRDLLVTAVRQADPTVVSMELPEQWYRLKIHGVPVKRYLSCGLSLAREEIELGTAFQLKRDPTWLRSPKEFKDQRGSTIVITVGSLEEARKLLTNGIRFGGARYRAEQYWEIGPDTVCPRCCNLGHRSFRACKDREPCCFICAGPHEGAEHMCKVINCTAKPGTACQHTPAKCGNCQGPHIATTENCPAKRAARKQERDRRVQKENPKQHYAQASQSPQSPAAAEVNKNQQLRQTRSSSVPASPRTPRGKETQGIQTPTASRRNDIDMEEYRTPRGPITEPNSF
jgi:hypothetical protein